MLEIVYVPLHLNKVLDYGIGTVLAPPSPKLQKLENYEVRSFIDLLGTDSYSTDYQSTWVIVFLVNTP